MGSSDIPSSVSVSQKSLGVATKHTENTSSKTSLGVSDIYVNGVILEKQVTVKTSNNNNINPDSKIQQTVSEKVIYENIGHCVSKRVVVGQAVSSDIMNPMQSSTVNTQTHFNVDCVRDAAASAVISAGIIVAPEVMIPALAISKAFN